MQMGNILKLVVIAVFLRAGALSAGESIYPFVIDDTFYYKTASETVINSRFNFNEPEKLKTFPLTFGNWSGEELAVENMPVVKPDFMFERIYKYKNGKALWFQLIRGRVERAVHVPSICYYNAGWRISERGNERIKIGNRAIPCGLIVAKKDGIYASELYFYLWGDQKRDFMKGCVMFRVAAMENDPNIKEEISLIKRFIEDMFTKTGQV